MDLGTVFEKLNKRLYESVEVCLEDINLIWRNCCVYNAEDSIIYGFAKTLEKQTNDLVNQLFSTGKKSYKSQNGSKRKYSEFDANFV